MRVPKSVSSARAPPGLSGGLVAALALCLAMSALLLALVVLRGAPAFAGLWMRSTTVVGVQPATPRSPLTVARCRASCLKEFSAMFRDDTVCMNDYECFECWQDCEMLEMKSSEHSEECAEKYPCLDGCRAACRFLKSLLSEAPPAQPVLETKAEAMLESDGLNLVWPCSGDGSTVHVVLWKMRARDNWTQLKQTSECGASLPTAGSARVLSVESSGLTAIYTPSAMELAAQTEKLPDIAGPGKPVNGSQWSLRLSSVIHQGAVVIAELSWRTPDTDLELARRKGTLLYLVTWEVDGGGITGNLYTDSSCVTLSLSADTVFHIQVELVLKAAGGPSRSPRLQVDTGGSFEDGSLVVVLPSAMQPTVTFEETDADRLTVVVIIVIVVLTMSVVSLAASWLYQKKRKAPWDAKQLFVQPPPVKKEVQKYDGDFRLAVPE